MKIIETNIPDINCNNIDKTKVELANKVIKKLRPLITEFEVIKNDEVKYLNESLKIKRREVLQNKNELERLIEVHTKKKKLKKLLDRISELVSHGLVYDTQLRKETIILLKVIETLSSDMLDYHLCETTKLITKRFSR